MKKIDLVNGPGYILEMKSINISEFKAKCIGMIKEAHRSKTSLVVTRHGQPLVRIEPMLSPHEQRKLGVLADVVTINGDIVHADFASEWEFEGTHGASS